MTTAAPRQIACRQAADARSINVEKRQATFVAATENPVETWRGPEVLRMAGMTTRQHVPFLDSHNQHDAGAVIGSLTHQVVGRELHVTVTYAKTQRAEDLWTLVRDGHLRGVSVGYFIRETLQLAEGEVNGEGDAEVRGPASVVTRWELIEVSQVAIGADPDALVRSFAKEAPVAEPTNEPKPVQDPAPEARVTKFEEIAEERQARRLAAVRTAVMAICPDSLRNYAEQVLLEKPEATVEDVRALLLKRHAEDNAPVGTPSQPEAPAAEPTPVTNSLTVDQVVSALRSLRS